MERKFDLDQRLIEFAASIIELVEFFPQTFAGKHLAGQMVRSGTAPEVRMTSRARIKAQLALIRRWYTLRW